MKPQNRNLPQYHDKNYLEKVIKLTKPKPAPKKRGAKKAGSQFGGKNNVIGYPETAIKIYVNY